MMGAILDIQSRALSPTRLGRASAALALYANAVWVRALHAGMGDPTSRSMRRGTDTRTTSHSSHSVGLFVGMGLMLVSLANLDLVG